MNDLRERDDELEFLATKRGLLKKADDGVVAVASFGPNGLGESGAV